MKSISLTGVGNEIMTLNESPNIDIMENIPGMIDYSFQLPNFNIPNLKIYSGYLYFNLTVETFDVQVWRGSTLCDVPSRIMVFPSGYKMNNGDTYWGTDFEPNMGTVKNNYVGFFGSTSKDILADWGLYDAQYLYFLRDFVLYWMKLMDEYGSEWNNHLLDNPKTYNVAVGMENASHVMDAFSKYGIKGVYNMGVSKLGSAYDYIKNFKNYQDIVLDIGITSAVQSVCDIALSGVGLSDGIVGVAVALSVSSLPTPHQFFSSWHKWKQQHGGGGLSFAKFLNHYSDPSNPLDTDTMWSQFGQNFADNVVSICDFLGGKPSSKSWADWYNKLSKYSYNSIIGEEINELSFMVRGCSYRMHHMMAGYIQSIIFIQFIIFKNLNMN